jgi:pyruvate dehydrogenase E1 component beta subunit
VLCEGEDPRHQGLDAERVIALPVADRANAAVAVGMALGGALPVLELSAPARLLACTEVLHEAAAIASAGEHAVPLVIRVPWGEEAGRLDGAVLDLLASIPGLHAVVPRDAATASGLVQSALASRAPVVLLEPRRLASRGDATSEPRALTAAEVVRPGLHVTLAAFGAGVATALQAADALAARGIEAEVVDLVAVAPVDAATLGRSIQQTGRLVVVCPESDPAFARRVCRTGLDEAFLYLEAPLTAGPDDDPTRLADVAERAVRF